MKFIEKLSLTIFSILILILSLILSFIIFNWIETTDIFYLIQLVKSNQSATNTTLVILIVLMLLAIKSIFFPSYSKEREERKEGILLENESGKLLISIDTIENLVKGVVAEFKNVRAINCKVNLDKQVNNVVIDLNLVVSSDTVIKDLSSNLQDKIKENIKTTTEIEVKEINIKIKNIETPKEQ